MSRRIITANSPLHAKLIVGLLEENGIAASVEGEALLGALGGVPLSATPVVRLKNESDADAALALLAKHDGSVNPGFCNQCGYDLRGLPEPRCPECGTMFRRIGLWRCAACGEHSEIQFSHCWKCAEARGDSLELPPDRLAALDSEVSKRLQPDCIRCHGTGRIYSSFYVTISIASGFLCLMFLLHLLAALLHGRYAATLNGTHFFVVVFFLCFIIALRNSKKSCLCAATESVQ